MAGAVAVALVGGWPTRITSILDLFGENLRVPHSISVNNPTLTYFDKAEPVVTSRLHFADALDLFLINFGVIINVDNGIEIDPSSEEEIVCFPFGFEIHPEFKGTPEQFHSFKCQTVMQYLFSETASFAIQKSRGVKSPRIRYAESGLVCPQTHRGEFLVVYSDQKGITVTTLKRFCKKFPGRPFGICPVLPCKTNTEE